jgi:hypothetical protein
MVFLLKRVGFGDFELEIVKFVKYREIDKSTVYDTVDRTP